MERTKERFERPEQPELPDDYFVVVAYSDVWYVSRVMAQAIEATLSEEPVAKWVTFVDLTGARVRMRTRLVESVYQCTAEQRALVRAFYRARKAERKAETDWDEDE